MLLSIATVKHKAGIVENKAYDNYEVLGFVVGDTNSSVVCGCDFKILKFKKDVFENGLARNLKALGKPEIKQVSDLEGVLIVPVLGEYGIKGGCEDFMLSLPDTYSSVSDTFPNENVGDKPEKPDKKK